MKKLSVKIGLLFFLLLNILLVSCNGFESNGYVMELKFNSKEFYENKTKWKNNKPQNYQFDYEVDIGSFGISIYVTSVVKNGVYDSSLYRVGEGKDSEKLPAEPEETLEELEEAEEEWDYNKIFLKQIYNDLKEFKLETIDDYIVYLEKRIEELKSVDFEEEKFTEYEIKVFYNPDYSFPFDYEIHSWSEKEPELRVGDYNGISGGISNFMELKE